MAYPKSERILEAIVTNVAGIKILAGFENDLVKVEREKTEGNPPDDGSALVTGGKMEADDDSPLGWEAWRLPVVITAWAFSPAGSTSIATRLHSIGADIYKAIARDRFLGGDISGLATYIDFDGSAPMVDESARAVHVLCNVKFRHLRGNPYSA